MSVTMGQTCISVMRAAGGIANLPIHLRRLAYSGTPDSRNCRPAGRQTRQYCSRPGRLARWLGLLAPALAAPPVESSGQPAALRRWPAEQPGSPAVGPGRPPAPLADPPLASLAASVVASAEPFAALVVPLAVR